MNLDAARASWTVPGQDLDHPPLILIRSYVPLEPYMKWAKAIAKAAGITSFSYSYIWDRYKIRPVMLAIMDHFRRRTAQILQETSPLQPGATPFRVTPTAPAYNLQRYPLDELMIGAYISHMSQVKTLPGLARIVESHDRQCLRVAQNPLLMEVVRTQLADIQVRTWRHVQHFPPSVVHSRDKLALYGSGKGFAHLRIGLNLADDLDQPTPAPALELTVYSERITGRHTAVAGLRMVVFQDIDTVKDLASTLMDYVFRYDIVEFNVTSRLYNGYIRTADPQFIDRLFNPTKQVV